MNLDAFLNFLSAAVSVLLASGAMFRARRHASRWAFAAGMATFGAERLFHAFQLVQATALHGDNWQLWKLSLLSVSPGIWLFFSLTYARGNAREFLKKWRVVLAVVFMLPIAAVVLFRASLVVSTDTLDQSITVYRLGLSGAGLQLVTLLATILALVNLEHTLRSAVGTARWRIKYMVMGVGVLLLVRLFTTTQSLLFLRIDPRLEILHSGAILVATVLIVRSLLRTGQLGLDVHPSQSVLQGSLTILLVGIYLLIVGGLAKIFTYLGGDSAFSYKALVVLALLVLLAVLLQSDRLRMHLRRFVSRHFQRPSHDYRTVWRKFTEGTAARMEQTEYCRAVVKLVAEIFQCLSVSVWLVGDRRDDLILTAATDVAEKKRSEPRPTPTECALVLDYFHKHLEPVDIDRTPGDWSDVLRRCHPDEFKKGGTRVCVPVNDGSSVIALLLLGDRVAGTPFNEQDFDLLKSLGDQIASGLLNVRLSQRLLQAREHEAFQTMATFFVHDLKNAASTLNLMLQNLPDHFDDPEFRADALRGVGKSVSHINHLILRLTQLRSELKIAPTETDLNAVVQTAATSADVDKDFVVENELSPLPPLSLDREQFAKVIVNLVINAREASASSGGKLKIRTSRSGKWALLEASDNGSGIPPDFLARSLFRPFQTTKKNGLGIGMFQSKMIIEAHGGKITVESTLGKGTTFRIFLPLAAHS